MPAKQAGNPGRKYRLCWILGGRILSIFGHDGSPLVRHCWIEQRMQEGRRRFDGKDIRV
jgi:hypothetical protein